VATVLNYASGKYSNARKLNDSERPQETQTTTRYNKKEPKELKLPGFCHLLILQVLRSLRGRATQQNRAKNKKSMER